MEGLTKIFQAVGIPFSALISIIFGMMILSFPIGTHLVFNSELGEEINFDYPISGLDFFLADFENQIPFEFQLGDAFIVFWSIYLIVFSIAIFGPQRDFVRTLSPIIAEGKKPMYTNYMVSAIRWFSILVLVSGIINFVQEGLGIFIEAPIAENNLIQFFDLTKAPLVEELIFRVLLIGVPIYAIYSHKSSISHFFKSLWHPYSHIHVYDNKKIISLIVLVAVLFGLAHIISGESWSAGKFSQAAASGIIIGWVYYRHGLVPAILIHWAANYFVFAYVFFIAQVNSISIDAAFSHSFINSLEILFSLAGVVSIILLLASRYYAKEKSLEV